MKNLTISLLVSALLASGSSMASETSQEASLHFISKDTALIGVSYGLDSVDGKSLILDERTSTQIAAGRRTVSYTCPSSSGKATNQVAVIDVAPGAHIELVCRSGQPALVRDGGC